MAYKRKRGLAQLFFGTVRDDQVQWAYRVRVALFFVLVVIMVAALFLIYQLSQIFYQLYLAEGERDHWQRPDDVIESLKLKDGDVVADVGSGVDYVGQVNVADAIFVVVIIAIASSLCADPIKHRLRCPVH